MHLLGARRQPKRGLLNGSRSKTALVHAGLKALVSRESARRLALLGGTQKDLKPIRRRRMPKVRDIGD